jgi:hypothetical protein
MANELANLKQELISISQTTDIGFNLTAETKQQIESLATQIEELNPTPEPTSQMQLVEGRWQLLYSTFGLERETTLQRLAFGKLPNVAVSVNGIFQEIYTNGQQYNNLIEFTAPSGVNGIVKVKAQYTLEGSQRLNVDFLETSVTSTNHDLSDAALRQALGVDADSPLASPLSFNGWSDITYLDDKLRLMRGNHQNLYVLLRDDISS